MNITETLDAVEANLKIAEYITPAERYHQTTRLMNELDALYKPLLSDGTLYSRRRDEARAYSSLMHNARNQNTILYYRSMRRKEVDEGIAIPFAVSDGVLNEYWITIRDLIQSGIEVLRQANDKNESEHHKSK